MLTSEQYPLNTVRGIQAFDSAITSLKKLLSLGEEGDPAKSPEAIQKSDPIPDRMRRVQRQRLILLSWRSELYNQSTLSGYNVRCGVTT